MSAPVSKRELPWSARLNRVAWVLLVVLLVFNFLAVVAIAINVPYWDDWSALDPGALDRTPHWGWIVSFHNPHRTVWTNLSIWLLYRLDGWNLKTHLVLNFGIYAWFVVGYLRTLEAWFSAPLGLVGLFLATAIPDEIHLHASNGQWTFALAFAFLGVVFAPRSDRWGWLSPLWTTAAVYSMGSGLVAAGGIVLLHVVLAALRPELRRRHLASAGLIVAAMLLWAVGYPGTASRTLDPFQRQFWSFTFTQLAGGFGYVRRTLPVLGGILAGLFVLLGVLRAATLASLDPVAQGRWCALLAWVGGLLLALASVSYSRGWAGDPGGLSGRYLIVSLFLVPPFWLLFRSGVLARIRPERFRSVATAAALVLLLFPLRHAFDFATVYGRQEARRLRGVRCFRGMVRQGLVPACPDIQPDLQMAPVHYQRSVALRLSYLAEQLDP
jgi:hypothetical protein